MPMVIDGNRFQSIHLEEICEAPRFNGNSLREIMWELKRADPALRHEMAVHTTGPGVIMAFHLENNSLPSFKLQNTERFGHRDPHFPGKWSPLLEHRHSGGWIESLNGAKAVDV